MGTRRTARRNSDRGRQFWRDSTRLNPTHGSSVCADLFPTRRHLEHFRQLELIFWAIKVSTRQSAESGKPSAYSSVSKAAC